MKRACLAACAASLALVCAAAEPTITSRPGNILCQDYLAQRLLKSQKKEAPKEAEYVSWAQSYLSGIYAGHSMAAKAKSEDFREFLLVPKPDELREKIDASCSADPKLTVDQVVKDLYPKQLLRGR